MRVRDLLSAAASAALFVSAGAEAQQVHTLAQDAAAFGHRSGVQAMAVSPDGTKLVYIAPAKDRWSAVMVVNVASGEDKPIMSAHADPDVLRWCNFAGNDRLVCRINWTSRDSYSHLINFSRLASMNLDGSDLKQLGQQSSAYDQYLRTYDGSVLDWHSTRPGTVLMQRAYVPEMEKGITRIVRNKEGLGVDIVDVRTTKSSQVEAPLPDS